MSCKPLKLGRAVLTCAHRSVSTINCTPGNRRGERETGRVGATGAREGGGLTSMMILSAEARISGVAPTDAPCRIEG